MSEWKSGIPALAPEAQAAWVERHAARLTERVRELEAELAEALLTAYQDIPPTNQLRMWLKEDLVAVWTARRSSSNTGAGG